MMASWRKLRPLAAEDEHVGIVNVQVTDETFEHIAAVTVHNEQTAQPLVV